MCTGSCTASAETAGSERASGWACRRAVGRRLPEDAGPDLDIPLTGLSTNITAWQASLQRHLSEECKAKGIAFDVQLMEDRDDIAAKIVEDFTAIDTEMSKRRVIASAAPSAWSIERLTDATLRAWPPTSSASTWSGTWPGRLYATPLASSTPA
ncbi:hypothetical protein [Streptomyces mobaraensis]|uniref:hypothetical protein n=1 Tax=Streptomyces mobaraensis TaxID=35621 RepID=UPI001F0400BB|nr:hypothetical protein [Streptomyces mobaraensis]